MPRFRRRARGAKSLDGGRGGRRATPRAAVGLLDTRPAFCGATARVTALHVSSSTAQRDQAGSRSFAAADVVITTITVMQPPLPRGAREKPLMQSLVVNPSTRRSEAAAAAGAVPRARGDGSRRIRMLPRHVLVVALRYGRYRRARPRHPLTDSGKDLHPLSTPVRRSVRRRAPSNSSSQPPRGAQTRWARPKRRPCGRERGC